MFKIIVYLIIINSIVFGGAEDTLKGKVIDAVTGESIGNANVMILSSEIGDATDENGEFTLENISSGVYMIIISHIGYLDEFRTVSIPQTEPLVIPLKETFFQMGEVVVTGTRTKNIHSNVPIAMEVVTRQDILDSGARDVAELLEERAGAFVNSSVAGGYTLNLIGIDSKYILILVDGQPAVGKFNDRISLDQFSTSTVERVEIIKGPNSSLYGSEAMGGVVNIITQKTAESYPVTVLSRFTGNDGGYNLVDKNSGKRDIRLNWVKNLKNVYYNLNIDLLKANVDKTNQYINVDEYDKTSLQSDIKYTLSNVHSFNILLNRFINGEDSHTRTLNANTKIQRNSLILRHNWTISDRWSSETIIRGTGYEREHLQRRPWGEIVNKNKSTETQVELEENVLFKDGRNTLNLGMEFYNSVFSSSRILADEKRLMSGGLYFQWHREVTDNIDVVTGSRFDDYSNIKTVISPRVAMMYTFHERWKFRASWGTGFRLPSFMDQYIDWDHIQFGYRITGNPDLRPESSRGLSFGVEYYHPVKYQISLFLYQNRFKDMINDYSIEPGLFTYKNVDKVLYRGIEIQGRWNISKRWLASWGYNYIDNRDEKTGRLVANTQPHSASMRISYKSVYSRVSGALNIKLVGPYYPEEYIPESGEYILNRNMRPLFGTINLTGRIRISQLFALGFGGQNLTDYTNERFGPFIGRSFYIELFAGLK